jgi:hypothetical protein
MYQGPYAAAAVIYREGGSPLYAAAPPESLLQRVVTPEVEIGTCYSDKTVSTENILSPYQRLAA